MRALLDTAAKLSTAARAGGITLVVGAGVSMGRRVPSWNALVAQLWSESFPKDRIPEPNGIPQFLPLALEIISRRSTARVFVDRLRSALYSKLALLDRGQLETSPETLAVLSRLIVQEHQRGPARRIQRVITFNVDDLVEHAVWSLSPRAHTLKPVVRASHHPERGTGEQAIPIYHLHGYLPHNPGAAWHSGAPDALVFTDSQYWASVAAPMSFANRVMSFALHDSRCVFIGCSMTDLNLMRWLALRATEIEADKAAQFLHRPRGNGGSSRRSARDALGRHFWVRPDSNDPTGFLSRALRLRGILSVPIEDWSGPPLRDLLAKCFPNLSPARKRRSSQAYSPA